MTGNSRWSKTQLQERSVVNPTCERILEKRVRMLACSIRCFQHLVVSNRSGLLGSTKLCGVTMERSWASFMNVVRLHWDDYTQGLHVAILVEHKAQKFFFPTHPHLTYITRAPCTCMHFTFFMSTLLFPDAFLPRNHGHFMNWKTEKRHFWRKSSSLSWTRNMTGNSRWSKTQLQERSVVNPTCERILEKECGCLLVRYVVSNTWSSRTEVDCYQINS